MTSVGEFFRRFLERLLGRHREGVRPPPRIREEAELAVLRHRAWTPDDWAEYAAKLAEASYVDGYRRGVEQKIEPRRPLLGRSIDRHNWSLWAGHPSTSEVLRRRGDPGDPLAGVPADKANEFLAELAEHRGTYTVIRHPRGGVGRSVTIPRPGSETEDEGE